MSDLPASMINVDVEIKGVAEIQAMVANCPHLKPLIAANDKTPFTDGCIDVYNGLGRKNENFLGRVSVQVKGRKHDGRIKELLNFQISRTALLGFQKDSGVLYFVVLVDSQGACTPYYSVLHPGKIDHLLRQSRPKQRSFSVRFERFPADPGEIEQIVAFALKTREFKLASTVDPVVFENMKSITVHTKTDLKLDEPIVLMPDETDFALELVTHAGMTLPMGGGLKIMPQEYAGIERDIHVRAGLASYDRATVRRLDRERTEVKIDEGLALVITEADKQRIVNVNFSAPSNFAARLKASEFLIGVTDTTQILIGDHELDLGSETSDEARRVEAFREHLTFLRQLRDLFERLGVNGSLIEYDELAPDQIQNLQAMHSAFVLGEDVLSDEGQPGHAILSIGRWAIVIVILAAEEPNKWRFINPFSSWTVGRFRTSVEDGAVALTAYDVLDPRDLPRVLNLNLGSIVESYEAIADSPQTLALANKRVLELLLAADTTDVRKSEFLEAARALNDWLLVREGETTVHLINQWQIRWRTDGLSTEDREAIRGLKHRLARSDDSMAAEAELSCALLLGDLEEINYLAGQMSIAKLEIAQTWPIWNLKEILESAPGDSVAPGGALAS